MDQVDQDVRAIGQMKDALRCASFCLNLVQMRFSVPRAMLPNLGAALPVFRTRQSSEDDVR
jgi:hypothetical protein